MKSTDNILIKALDEMPVKKARKGDFDRATRKLVKRVDAEGTNLTRSEIDFIANLIDTDAKTFLPVDARRVRRIYYNKVVNGKPEVD